MKRSTISRSAEVMGGTPVFAGTRVPVQTLLDYLEAGESIDDFLKGFPAVSREQVIAFLEKAKDCEEFGLSKVGKTLDKLGPPHRSPKPRQPGGWEGRMRISKDFDAPLPSAIEST
jgi:uncharacterized protein (DUF433 family)